MQYLIEEPPDYRDDFVAPKEVYMIFSIVAASYVWLACRLIGGF
jgi:hypothetical protein